MVKRGRQHRVWRYWALVGATGLWLAAGLVAEAPPARGLALLGSGWRRWLVAEARQHGGWRYWALAGAAGLVAEARQHGGWRYWLSRHTWLIPAFFCWHAASDFS